MQIKLFYVALQAWIHYKYYGGVIFCLFFQYVFLVPAVSLFCWGVLIFFALVSSPTELGKKIFIFHLYDECNAHYGVP